MIDHSHRKIGDRVWLRDYEFARRDGKWKRVEIVGETRVSWIVGLPDHKWAWKKVPKKSTDPVRYEGIAWSIQEVVEKNFVAENNYKIGTIVGRVKDYETLRKIADLIGYEEELERFEL